MNNIFEKWFDVLGGLTVVLAISGLVLGVYFLTSFLLSLC